MPSATMAAATTMRAEVSERERTFMISWRRTARLRYSRPMLHLKTGRRLGIRSSRQVRPATTKFLNHLWLAQHEDQEQRSGDAPVLAFPRSAFTIFLSGTALPARNERNKLIPSRLGGSIRGDAR